MLPAINPELIRLLGQKITLLSQSSKNSAENADITHLLAENGVPEFVWKSLMLSCAAACANPEPAPVIEPRKITIIGGCGKMGHFFGRQLAQAGHHVSNMGRESWSDAPELLGGADLVLLAVPIEQTLNIVEKASLFLDPSTALADLTSLKTPVVSAMLEYHPGLFWVYIRCSGREFSLFLSQNVVVCPGRHPEAFKWFLDFMEERGKLSSCTSEEHDRLMVNVQAIRHFISFSLGVFLAQEGDEIRRTLDFASPLYRLQLDMVSRLFAQDSSLSFKIMLATSEHRSAIARLGTSISHLARMIEQNEGIALQGEFDTSRRFFEQDADRALSESNYLIDRLSVFLAAQDGITPILKTITTDLDPTRLTAPSSL